MDNGLNFHDNLLYEKPAARFSSGSRSLRYSDVYEYVFVLSKGRPNTINLIQDKKNKGYGTSFTRDGGRNKDGSRNRDAEKKKIPVKEFGVRHNIWKIVNSYGVGQKNKKAYEHPALMPMQLANDLIKSYTNPGNLVLDPFMGSGTTARESYALDRDWIGFEIDETYHTLCEEINTAEMNSIFDKV